MLCGLLYIALDRSFFHQKVSTCILPFILFINLFICFYLLAIFAVRSSGTAEAIHTARLLQLVLLIRGA